MLRSSVPPERWGDFSERSSEENVLAWPIGQVEEGHGLHVIGGKAGIEVPKRTQEVEVVFLESS